MSGFKLGSLTFLLHKTKSYEDVHYNSFGAIGNKGQKVAVVKAATNLGNTEEGQECVGILAKK